MKKTFLSILTFLLFSFFCPQVFADLTFEQYQINAEIQQDGNIQIQEFFDVDFHTEHHGIQRRIPLHYTVDISDFQIFVDHIQVPEEPFEIFDERRSTLIKIGDAEKTLKGKKKYEIDYDLYGVIRNFSGMGYSELYRNLVGDEWENDFKQISAQITFPHPYPNLSKEDFQLAVGETIYESIDDFPGTFNWTETGITLIYPQTLPAYQGITLAVKFPNDYFTFDHERQAALFLGYTEEYLIDKGTLSLSFSSTGITHIDETWQITPQSESPTLRGILPYYYFTPERGQVLLKWGDIFINGQKEDLETFSTSTWYQTFPIVGEATLKPFEITKNTEVFGLITPFTGSWAQDEKEEEIGIEDDYRFQLTIPLEIFTFLEMKELDIVIDLPEEVETIYKEDISLIKDGERFSFDEILPLGVSIGLSGHSLLIDFSSGFFQKYPLYDDTLFVRFTTGFQLNETELEGLITLGNDQTRYRSDFSFSSFLMLLLNLLLGVGCWFWNRGLRGTPQEKKATTLYYNLPRGVTPSEAGVLVDYEINGKDLGCLIYQWAIQKLIEITPDPSNRKSFIIKKLKEISKGVPEYEKVLFKGMFSLNNDGIFSLAFSKHRISPFFTKASRKLRESIDQKERFRKPFKELESLKALPLRIRKYWRIFLIVLIMLLEPGILNDYFLPIRQGFPIFNTLLIGILLFTNRITTQELCQGEGKKLREECLGYKEFLLKVDKERLETMLKQDPYYLEKVLPTAFAFGIQSEILEKITPEVLQSYGIHEQGFDYFVDHFSLFNTYLATPVISSSSHSGYSSSRGFSSGSSFGGGFSSGGGGGGGGGGGW